MASDNTTRKHFRAIGHKLNPVVIVKQLSENVSAEIERALDDHELIKIRVLAEDREDKKAMIEEICSRHDAELIQLSGHVALLFRAADRPNPKLSNVLRYQSLINQS
jgi:RNA-binding protein